MVINKDEFRKLMQPGGSESDKSGENIDDLDLKKGEDAPDVKEDEKVDVKNKEGEEIIEKKDDKKQKKKRKVKDPFERMVDELKELSVSNKAVKALHLTFEKQHNGFYLVYQGQKDVVWARLRNTGCSFERKSLLRVILNLDDKHYLKKYFRNYSVITGSKILPENRS